MAKRSNHDAAVNTPERFSGAVNPHLVGIVMKEAVRRAIGVIREKRFVFEASVKRGHSGKLDDLVTNADHAAQDVYVRMLRECFPSFGIVAEEKGLRIESRRPHADLFFTVDPLDGTKAFARRQSHGIGTMISLVRDRTVIAAYVGDVMTQEIFGFRPGSDTAHRISEFDHAEELHIDTKESLLGQRILLREDPDVFAEAIRRLTRQGVFKGIEVAGGSIGTSMARLWKGEVGAVAMNARYATPWDHCPIVGVSLQLGFVFLKAAKDSDRLRAFTPLISKDVQEMDGDVLVIHKSRQRELRGSAR